MNELTQFVEATKCLSKNWKDTYDIGYPFSKSFDEVMVDIWSWYKKVGKAAKNSTTTTKKYILIVTSEDERYGREVQLNFFADKPWEGLLEDVVFGDNWNELFFDHKKDNEGLFYQLYATDTGKRIGYGILDPDSPAEEIEAYENSHHFADDDEKMYDFLLLDKEEFLKSYSYLTESEYNKTLDEVMERIKANRSEF